MNFINSDVERSLFVDADQLLYITGGNSAIYHDGTTATSQMYRESAMYVEYTPQSQALIESILAYHFGDGTPQDFFPPMGEFNHLQNYGMGPLKTNWSQPCPPPSENVTRADREELCISKLEFVFGTQGLARLEAIKAAVDPNHLFNCYACVGYKETMPPPISTLAPSVAPQPIPTEAPTPAPLPTNAPSSASGIGIHTLLVALAAAAAVLIFAE